MFGGFVFRSRFNSPARRYSLRYLDLVVLGRVTLRYILVLAFSQSAASSTPLNRPLGPVTFVSNKIQGGQGFDTKAVFDDTS